MAPSRPNNAANRDLHLSALHSRISLKGTRSQFEVLQSDIQRVERDIISGSSMVNVHIASIYNRYAELFPQNLRKVAVLPSDVFNNWKAGTLKRPTAALDFIISLAKPEHVAFPFYWQATGRWILVVLANFGGLVSPDEAPLPADHLSDFFILLLDAVFDQSKTKYVPLYKPFRDFTRALLEPCLDIRGEAITAARFIAPSAPMLDTDDAQALQPGHYLILLLADPLRFANKCKSGKMSDDDWDLSGRKEVLRQFKSFLTVHGSLITANLSLMGHRVGFLPPEA